MKRVKVFIEKSEYGYSAFMDNSTLDYGCIGEGKTVEETIADFQSAYDEMREHYKEKGKEFEEVELEFFYDTASFLQAFVKAFSLAGLERITDVNQTQLGHYLHGRSKPSRKTIQLIEQGVHNFAKDLSAIRFS